MKLLILLISIFISIIILFIYCSLVLAHEYDAMIEEEFNKHK